jgi:hypothetical protein
MQLAFLLKDDVLLIVWNTEQGQISITMAIKQIVLHTAWK